MVVIRVQQMLILSLDGIVELMIMGIKGTHLYLIYFEVSVK